MSQQTLINGNRYSFTSLSVDFGGGRLPNGQAAGNPLPVPRGAFKSFNYDCSQDAGIVQGNQVTMVGRTAGYGMGTGSFEMLVSEIDDFFGQLTVNGTFPIMTIDFDVSISYSINDIDVRTDVLQGCRITKIGSSNQQGNDATTKTCDLSIARIYLNGIAAFADSFV